MDRPQKLARVQALRDNLPYVSHVALAAVLAEASREPLPTSVGRRQIREARDATTNHPTPYGPVHQVVHLETADGEPFACEMQHPFAMLYHSCARSRALSDLMKSVAARRPSTLASPWQLILYTDEVLPGNQLAYKHERKAWIVYWSILQFGMHVLCDEECVVVQWRSLALSVQSMRMYTPCRGMVVSIGCQPPYGE